MEYIYIFQKERQEFLVELEIVKRTIIFFKEVRQSIKISYMDELGVHCEGCRRENELILLPQLCFEKWLHLIRSKKKHNETSVCIVSNSILAKTILFHFFIIKIKRLKYLIKIYCLKKNNKKKIMLKRQIKKSLF